MEVDESALSLSSCRFPLWYTGGMAYELTSLTKWMTVRKLKQLLATLDDDLILVPNHVNNLSIYPDQRRTYDSSLGIINFGTEEVELWSSDEEE